MNCDRCGKEIKDSHKYKVTISDLEGTGTYTCTWCEDCYNDFMDTINSSSFFQDIKPAITQDDEKNVKAKIAQLYKEEK